MALYESAFILAFWLLYRLVGAAERAAAVLDRLAVSGTQHPPAPPEGEAPAP